MNDNKIESASTQPPKDILEYWQSQFADSWKMLCRPPEFQKEPDKESVTNVAESQ